MVHYQTLAIGQLDRPYRPQRSIRFVISELEAVLSFRASECLIDLIQAIHVVHSTEQQLKWNRDPP